MADSDWSDHMSIKLPVKGQLLYISMFLFGLSMYFMILKKNQEKENKNIFYIVSLAGFPFQFCNIL